MANGWTAGWFSFFGRAPIIGGGDCDLSDCNCGMKQRFYIHQTNEPNKGKVVFNIWDDYSEAYRAQGLESVEHATSVRDQMENDYPWGSRWFKVIE
jgi:hypothetical protein